MTVAKSMQKIIKRIPGELPTPPKNEIDGKIIDLSSKTIPELIELRERQMKLLTNKLFLSKLADKGSKIQTFLDKVVNELKVKQEEENTCRIFDNMKLNSCDKEFVLNVEWEGKTTNRKDAYLDSDDDSDPEDVIHILSQHTAQEKKVKVLQTEDPLITPQDLLNIGENPHVKYLIDKTETKAKPKQVEQFKPYKTTISDVHNFEKEILRKKHKHWEVTAATPPHAVHGPAKVLNLEESLKLQKEYNIHLKEVEAKHAAEKLQARTGIKMAELPENTSLFGKYREADSDDSEASDVEGSDKEVYDEEPERGGVVFTVMK